jgi:hypothetical protein
MLLAGIRIANGGAALFAPRLVARRAGSEDPHPTTLYALRLFGVRTVLIGIDLLRRDGPVRRNALNAALIVHASDTLAAFASGREGVPARHARMLQAISGLNTILAVTARFGGRR